MWTRKPAEIVNILPIKWTCITTCTGGQLIQILPGTNLVIDRFSNNECYSDWVRYREVGQES